ncbi:UNVERIFIED_CONTAM: protein BEARSKIN2 [Sesamum radiatum]|uniref:Protein BEARSKIN2 n=1 Tax=Sesamum radiatum TaxID=300843 RepID=A0AAW2UMQ5_SESRA
MSSHRTCMSSSDLNMNAVVQEEYPGSSWTSTMNCLPVGYRFLPTDTELIVHYLKRKICWEERNGTCFVLGRKSSSGTRADRITPYGYWKATSGDKTIRHNGREVGYRKTLVYYMKAESHNSTARKTDWIMHEYRLKNHSDPAPSDAPENVDRLSDDIVVCRIHNHNKKYWKNNGATYQPNPIPAGVILQSKLVALITATNRRLMICSMVFDELMDKGMEFLPDVMNMEF